MKLLNTVSTALVTGALLVALAACAPKEGPAEEAGKKVDESMEQLGENIEAAGEKIQDTAEGKAE